MAKTMICFVLHNFFPSHFYNLYAFIFYLNCTFSSIKIKLYLYSYQALRYRLAPGVSRELVSDK
jgi:hypothetical protein